MAPAELSIEKQRDGPTSTVTRVQEQADQYQQEPEPKDGATRGNADDVAMEQATFEASLSSEVNEELGSAQERPASVQHDKTVIPQQVGQADGIQNGELHAHEKLLVHQRQRGKTCCYCRAVIKEHQIDGTNQ